ncbi:MAG: folate family ECF transporter S component [Proteobacteria bacterium]|nr:folate family ECF transporter S component [Pseudomonadota bacterium]
MKKHISIKSLVLASLLVALSVILTRFLSIQLGQTLRIGFGKLPIMLSGILLGPVWGLLVGVITDLIGFIINPMGGVFLPGITISYALIGFLPGVIVHVIFRQKKVWTITLCAVINGLLVDLLLTTLWLTLAFGQHSYTALLGIRLLNVLLMIAVNAVLAVGIVKSTEQLIGNTIAVTE